MLVEFRVKNFLSIKEEQVLSMAAGSDESLPENITQASGFKLLKTAGIYGANAAGKTNIVLAIRTMSEIIRESASKDPGEEINITPFMLDENSRNLPTTFEITFLTGGSIYEFGFSATKDRIVDEWLICFPDGNRRAKQKWYHRKLCLDTGEYEWKFSSYLKGKKNLLKERTRANSLFLAVATYLNHTQLEEVLSWFVDSLRTSITPIDLTAKLVVNERVPMSWIESGLEYADFGIKSLDVKKIKVQDAELPGSMPIELRKFIRENASDNFVYNVSMKHKGKNPSLNYDIPFGFESRGTQRFFRILGPIYLALMQGRTIFADELAQSFHPHLTEFLITLMQDSSINKNGAQLIFTTHDTTLLSKNLFRHDQIWFAEKDKLGATSLYSLSDFKDVRKDAAIEKGYHAGRFGALPILQSFEIEEFGE